MAIESGTMAQTVFFSNAMRVAATTDAKGPRLIMYADGAELDSSAVESLISVLDGWKRDIKLIGVCPECSTRRPLHRLTCRQAPAQKYE